MPAGDFRFSAGTEIFEPLVREDVALYPEHNQIDVWTWGDFGCCLEAGATSATLADSGLTLGPGDLLVFEEIVGADTGLPADADRTHRQVVRLTSVTPGHDALYDQPLLQVAWDRADALTFPLCISARGGPDCADLVVGVARGNVVLVEHGGSNDWCGGVPQQVTWPPAPPPATGCPAGPGWGCPADGPVSLPAVPARPVPPLRHRRPVAGHPARRVPRAAPGRRGAGRGAGRPPGPGPRAHRRHDRRGQAHRRRPGLPDHAVRRRHAGPLPGRQRPGRGAAVAAGPLRPAAGGQAGPAGGPAPAGPGGLRPDRGRRGPRARLGLGAGHRAGDRPGPAGLPRPGRDGAAARPAGRPARGAAPRPATRCGGPGATCSAAAPPTGFSSARPTTTRC